MSLKTKKIIPSHRWKNFGIICFRVFANHRSVCRLFLSCLVLSCLVLSCLVLYCLVLSCLVLPCLALPGLHQKLFFSFSLKNLKISILGPPGRFLSHSLAKTRKSPPYTGKKIVKKKTKLSFFIFLDEKNHEIRGLKFASSSNTNSKKLIFDAYIWYTSKKNWPIFCICTVLTDILDEQKSFPDISIGPFPVSEG